MNAASISAGIVLAASFIIAFATVPLAIRVGLRLNITSEPSSTALGVSRIPAFGGASIMLALVGALALVGQLPLWIAVGAGALYLVGVVDDAIALRPYQKLLAQTVVAAWALRFALPEFPLTPWWLVNFLLVGFWLVTCSNAFNLVDGLDGLSTGTGLIAAVALAAIGAIHHDSTLLISGLALGGGLGGFLVYNFPPASIIMGDAGALPIGFVLGVLALQGGAISDNTRLSKYLLPVLIMLVPLLDTLVVSVTRLATANGVSKRGLDHSHHRLLALGLNDRQVAGVTWGAAAAGAFAALAVALLPHELVVAAVPFIVLVAAVVALFMMDLTFEASPPAEVHGVVQGLARLILNFGYKRRIAEATVDLALISAAFSGAWLLRLDFSIPADTIYPIEVSLPVIAVLTYAAFLAAGVYRGIWRYAGFSDVLRFVNGSVLAGILVAVVARFVPLAVSGSIVVLYVILLFNLLVASRLSFQALRRGIAALAVPDERVLIVGAGEAGAAAATFVIANRRRALRLVGFVDDDAFKLNKLVHGQRVLGMLDDLERIHAETPFEQIVVASELTEQGLQRLSSFAQSRRLALRGFSMRVSELRTPASRESNAVTAALAPTPAGGR